MKMKVIGHILLVLALTASVCMAFSLSANQGANQAISRREIFNRVTNAAVATTVVLSGPSSALATNIGTLPPINGIYSDPNHLDGYRIVRVLDKSNALVTLQDEPNGPIFSVSGKIVGTTVTLDFSAKGGPKDVVATLVGDDKLKFPDGNTWTKISGVDGVYADPNHPSGYRVVRIAKGKDVFITLQDEPNGEAIELKGMQKENGSVSIDFSPKGGPNNLTAIVKDGKLVFPDGNAWTKI